MPDNLVIAQDEMMVQKLELGLDTFGDVTRSEDGRLKHQAEVIRDTIAEAALADEVGVDAIALGEHHREDFAISAPEIILAAIAARTSRIRLGTAVTVLSSDDPIRLFQRFSTLDAISRGRGEIILGRGSFTESFPLFGFDLRDYERLFEEKLDLFAAIIENEKVTWSGSIRPPLIERRIFPPLEHGSLRTWIGVGGSPESVVRAARYGMPLMLAIIGGSPSRFRPYVDLYHRALEQFGRPTLPVGVHSPGYIADTDQRARDEYWEGYKAMHDRIGGERGWPPMTRAAYEQEIEMGSLYVGSPETVARKIASTISALGLSRFSLKYSGGPLRHDNLMHLIELYGREVIPRVRQLLA